MTQVIKCNVRGVSSDESMKIYHPALELQCLSVYCFGFIAATSLFQSILIPLVPPPSGTEIHLFRL